MKKNAKLILLLTIIIIQQGFLAACAKESPISNSSLEEISTVTEVFTTETTSDATMETSLESSLESTLVTKTEPFSTITYYPYREYRLKYPDFIGWISIPGTQIDYPIVQTSDNEHYLNFDYTNTKNYAGAIYMDYKNQGNFYDNHVSLYGHYMKNGSMFHDLHLYKEKAFFEENHTLFLTGLREKYRYEIFSVHIVSADNYYLYLNLDDAELLEYAKHFQNVSLFNHDLNIVDELKLLTLVTCTYEFDNARILMHAYQVESVPFEQPNTD